MCHRQIEPSRPCCATASEGSVTENPMRRRWEGLDLSDPAHSSCGTLAQRPLSPHRLIKIAAVPRRRLTRQESGMRRSRGLACGFRTPHNSEKPFPLDGGRVGMGVWPPASKDVHRRTPTSLAVIAPTARVHPQPTPSPIEGEGFSLHFLRKPKALRYGRFSVLPVTMAPAPKRSRRASSVVSLRRARRSSSANRSSPSAASTKSDRPAPIRR